MPYFKHMRIKRSWQHCQPRSKEKAQHCNQLAALQGSCV